MEEQKSVCGHAGAVDDLARAKEVPELVVGDVPVTHVLLGRFPVWGPAVRPVAR